MLPGQRDPPDCQQHEAGDSAHGEAKHCPQHQRVPAQPAERQPGQSGQLDVTATQLAGLSSAITRKAPARASPPSSARTSAAS